LSNNLNDPRGSIAPSERSLVAELRHVASRAGADTADGGYGKAGLKRLELRKTYRRNHKSAPLIGVFRPIRALYPNDAETLACRRAHDHPALLAFVHLGTQFFEPCNFGRNVVGLDINVHAAFVVHALNLHAELVGRRFQHAVIAATSRMLHIDRTAQRVRPKLRGGVDIIGVAIDQQPVDARAMHAIHLRAGHIWSEEWDSRRDWPLCGNRVTVRSLST